MSRKESFTRAKHLITVRKSGDVPAIQQAEQSVAVDIVGPDVLACDIGARRNAHSRSAGLTPFAATEAFAKALHAAMVWLAGHFNAKSPKVGKYDLLFATPVMFKDVWTTRQVVDDLGIPYDFYAQHAVAYWVEQGNTRTPRPTQLSTPDAVAHVMGLWAETLMGEEFDPQPAADCPSDAVQHP